MKAHRQNVYLDTTCRVQLFLFRFYRYLFRSESRDSPFKLSVKGAIAESIEGSLSRTLSDGIIDSKYQKTRSSNRKRAYFSHPRSPVQSIFVHRRQLRRQERGYSSARRNRTKICSTTVTAALFFIERSRKISLEISTSPLYAHHHHARPTFESRARSQEFFSFPQVFERSFLPLRIREDTLIKGRAEKKKTS